MAVNEQRGIHRVDARPRLLDRSQYSQRLTSAESPLILIYCRPAGILKLHWPSDARLASFDALPCQLRRLRKVLCPLPRVLG